MDTNVEYPAELKREIGKAYFFNSDGDKEKEKYGLKLINEACAANDPEAAYIMSRLILDGMIRTSAKDPVEQALSLMCAAANNGYIQARTYLNAYCEHRYAEEYDDLPVEKHPEGVLADFDGKPIKINRQGIFTPIDAVLEYKDGKNVLTLSVNVIFMYGEEFSERKKFEQAVCDGIRAWEGEYTVFGGQKLSVRVVLTRDGNVFDNLVVMPVMGNLSSTILALNDVIGTNEKKRQIRETIEDKRSFAVSGFKWSVNSRKFIYIQSEDGKFDNYEEIMHVSKHEFGHSLGLGDLYSSKKDFLGGVAKGKYAELDSYAIRDRFYNLVMCDHHGPISNNDVEMVVLAFRENKMQHYQPSRIKGKISTALGRGN
ncbi:MAG: hypothetical protein E7555_08475 [Ruminococcaceae bacterium]|nr:hypothetical protein [Oscillospiraceae bacterium]